MLYNRVIAVLLFDDGAIYRSQQFARHFRLGDPLQQMERYKCWDVDEIIYLDMHRRPNGRALLEFLPQIARNCFAPLSVGGAISSLEDIHQRLDAGADRIVVNTAAFDRPQFIDQAAQRYGKQAIVISIDARREEDGRYQVFVDGGRRPTGIVASDWAAEAAARGAGEIFINSIDCDGMGSGYDLELIRSISIRVSIPVIACGGVGHFGHLAAAICSAGADAAAAANIFCFRELSYVQAKDTLISLGIPVRRSRMDE